ncbi:hypothetical protein [Secundilactobacillus collinoides]|uniref:Uncharacterized protein n=1 Tax=Secundilactobacillus collinoides TaxID=33960 RepID=A0A166GV91_SECCO|nr:hypothetical protein [Secundilactobacillus collinoides]KZL40222.1 hypothetical protein TY91_08865 [Secundilactobacillus collinoides]
MLTLIIIGIILFFGLRIFFGLFGWLFRILGILIIGGLIFAFASSFIGIFLIVAVVLVGSWFAGEFLNN